MAFASIVDEMRGEMEDTLKNFEGHVVVGLGFADAGSEDEAEFACASFFVGMH